MTNEAKVGLLVVGAALLFFVGIQFLRSSSLFGGGTDIVAVFNDAAGLRPGGPVRMSGVRIGSVRSVELAPSGRQVYVRVGLDGGINVPRGSRVSIAGFAALGDVAVEFTPPAGAIAGRPLADGDTVVARGSSDLMGAIQENAAPLVARADTLLGVVLNTYRSAEPTIVEGANDLAAAAAQVRFITTALGHTFSGASRDGLARIGTTFERLDGAAAAAERAALNIEGLTEEYQAGFGGRGITFADDLQASIAQLSATLRRLDTSLSGFDTTATQFGTLTARLDTTLTRLNSPQGSLGLLLADPALYNNANQTMQELQRLLQNVQQDPSRYTRGVVRVF